MNHIVSLAITTGIFLIVFVVHLIAHRILVSKGYISIKILLLYPLGLCTLLFIRSIGLYGIPVYSMIVYALASLLLSVTYLSVFLGGQTPASMILDAFEKKKSLTDTQIRSLFTVDSLLWKRMDDLIAARLVSTKGSMYKTTFRGQLVNRFFTWYRALIHTTHYG